jgi:hypothetical protein
LTRRLSADKIIVEFANCGDLASQNSARIRDAKKIVGQALRQGDGRFTVSAMAEGDDPCYGTVKILKVNYRLKGHPAEFPMPIWKPSTCSNKNNQSRP